MQIVPDQPRQDREVEDVRRGVVAERRRDAQCEGDRAVPRPEGRDEVEGRGELVQKEAVQQPRDRLQTLRRRRQRRPALEGEVRRQSARGSLRGLDLQTVRRGRKSAPVLGTAPRSTRRQIHRGTHAIERRQLEAVRPEAKHLQTEIQIRGLRVEARVGFNDDQGYATLLQRRDGQIGVQLNY